MRPPLKHTKTNQLWCSVHSLFDSFGARLDVKNHRVELPRRPDLSQSLAQSLAQSLPSTWIVL